MIGGEAAGGAEETEAGDAPIIKMVSMMLIEAHNMRASDIHLEPFEKRRLRPRIRNVDLSVDTHPGMGAEPASVGSALWTVRPLFATSS